MIRTLALDEEVYVVSRGWEPSYFLGKVTNITPSGLIDVTFKVSSESIETTVRFSETGEERGRAYRGYYLDFYKPVEERKQEVIRNSRLRKAYSIMRGIECRCSKSSEKKVLVEELQRIRTLVDQAQQILDKVEDEEKIEAHSAD